MFGIRIVKVWLQRSQMFICPRAYLVCDPNWITEIWSCNMVDDSTFHLFIYRRKPQLVTLTHFGLQENKSSIIHQYQYLDRWHATSSNSSFISFLCFLRLLQLLLQPSNHHWYQSLLSNQSGVFCTADGCSSKALLHISWVL